MAAVKSITNIVLLIFLTNSAPQNVYFIEHYHLFLRKKYNVYVAVITIFIFLCRHEIKLVFDD